MPATASSTKRPPGPGPAVNGAAKTPSPQKDSGRRAARTERTRAALVAAARKVFTRDGFTDAKISDISRMARVAYGTFYTYFTSKEEIFREVIMEVHAEAFDAHRRGTDDSAGQPPLARIAAANRQYFDAYRKNARLLASLEHVATSNDNLADLHRSSRSDYIDRAVRAVRTWQAEGLARADLDVECVVRGLTFMVERYAYLTFVLDHVEIDEDRVLDAISGIWGDALGLSARAGHPA